MSHGGNSLDEMHGEAEAGYRIMDAWLQMDADHTDPGFLLPSQVCVVAWCEAHARTLMWTAAALLWVPLLAAMYYG